MCGRYTLATPAGELVEAFDVPELNFEWPARFNIAPGQKAPIVAEDGRGRRMGLLTWGLVPGWMDEPGAGFINARSESVATKPSFREGFARRRCLVPADGFYEWRRGHADGKQPFWIHPAEGGVIAFAGLWESWRRPGQESRHTFTILTTDASRDVADIHPRMPVVISERQRSMWLDRATAPADLHALLRPAPDGIFVSHPVSRRVNRPSIDEPDLIEPVDPEPPTTGDV